MNFLKQIFGSSGMASTTKNTKNEGCTPIKVKKEEPEFPTTLEGFGYTFNEEGRLVEISSGKPFEFNVSQDHHYNQKRYEALGEIITTYVYDLLETRCGLQKLFIPVDRQNAEPQTFIFHSEDAFTNPDRILLLIHGSGVVRAGQWARRLIINDCLNSGTQIPYIEEAKKQGYGVIVFNGNDNYITDENGKRIKIRGSEDPEKHLLYVWKTFLKSSPTRNIAIVAHSYGGVCAVTLVKKYFEDLKYRIFAIAMTDSVHSLAYQAPSKQAIEWLTTTARNWIGSPEPVDTPIPLPRKVDIPMVSAGHKAHEMTSWSSFDSVFKFLAEKVADRYVRKSKRWELQPK